MEKILTFFCCISEKKKDPHPTNQHVTETPATITMENENCVVINGRKVEIDGDYCDSKKIE